MKKKKTIIALIALFAVILTCGGFFADTEQRAYAEETAVVDLADGEINTPYSQSVRLPSHVDGYKYLLYKGLPLCGLTLSEDGIISGTPLVSGVCVINFVVTDGNNEVAEGSVRIKIKGTRPHARSVEETSESRVWYDEEGKADSTNTSTQTQIIEYDQNMKNVRKEVIYDGILNYLYVNEYVGKNVSKSYFFHYEEDGTIDSISVIDYEYQENPFTQKETMYDYNLREGRQTIEKRISTLTNTPTERTQEGKRYKLVNGEYVMQSYSFSAMHIDAEDNQNYSAESYTYTDNTKSVMLQKTIRTTVGNTAITESRDLNESTGKVNYSKSYETRKNENAMDTLYIQYEPEVGFDCIDHVEKSRERQVSENIIESSDSIRKRTNNTRIYDDGTLKRIDSINIIEVKNADGSFKTNYERYQNDVLTLTRETYESSRKVTVFDTTMLLFILNECGGYFGYVEMAEGVDTEITEDVTVEDGITVKLNNLSVGKNVKITVDESSNLIVGGDLIIGNKKAKSNVTISGEEILGKTDMDVQFFISLGVVAAAALIMYIVGAVMYAKRGLNGQFFRAIYFYIRRK